MKEKEFTVTMNAQITFVIKECPYVDEQSIRDTTKESLEKDFKRCLGAADVVVSDLKLFIRDKENNDGK